MGHSVAMLQFAAYGQFVLVLIHMGHGSSQHCTFINKSYKIKIGIYITPSFSQDYIEHFFGLIRSKFGYTNSPTFAVYVECIAKF